MTGYDCHILLPHTATTISSDHKWPCGGWPCLQSSLDCLKQASCRVIGLSKIHDSWNCESGACQQVATQRGEPTSSLPYFAYLGTLCPTPCGSVRMSTTPSGWGCKIALAVPRIEASRQLCSCVRTTKTAKRCDGLWLRLAISPTKCHGCLGAKQMSLSWFSYMFWWCLMSLDVLKFNCQDPITLAPYSWSTWVLPMTDCSAVACHQNTIHLWSLRQPLHCFLHTIPWLTIACAVIPARIKAISKLVPTLSKTSIRRFLTPFHYEITFCITKHTKKQLTWHAEAINSKWLSRSGSGNTVPPVGLVRDFLKYSLSHSDLHGNTAGNSFFWYRFQSRRVSDNGCWFDVWCLLYFKYLQDSSSNYSTMQTVSTILTICDNAWHLPDIRLYCSLLEAAFLRETIGVVAAVSTNLGKWWQNTHDSHDDVGSTNRLIDSIWLNFGVFFPRTWCSLPGQNSTNSSWTVNVSVQRGKQTVNAWNFWR